MKKILAPVLFMSAALSLNASYYPQAPNSSSDGRDGWHETTSGWRETSTPTRNNYPPHLHLDENNYQANRRNNNNYQTQSNSEWTSQTQGQRYNDNYQQESRNLNPNDSYSTEEDRNIAKRIRDFLRGELNQVTVQVNNGKVTLRGTVASEADIDKIEQTVNKLQGVKSFNNQLIIRDNRGSSLNSTRSYISDSSQTTQQANTKDTFQTEEDKALVRRIRERLSQSDLRVIPEALIIRINNGNVTLIGIVETEDDRSAVEEKVGNVPGVKTLTNQINVRDNKGSFLNGRGDNIALGNQYNSTLKQTTTVDSTSDTYQTEDDRTLGTRIRDFLHSGSLSKRYDNHIVIRINNGNVTLRGTVDNADDKAKIEANVKKFPGVKNVDNQITVRDNRTSWLNSSPRSQVAESTQFRNQTLTKDSHGDSFQTNEDRELVKKIREALKGGWFSKGYDDIAVVANNGNVSLLGKVDNQNDINKIEERVKNVEGIRNIDLQISLKKPTK